MLFRSNHGVFAPKLAGSIFSGPTTKLKILLKEKKKGKFCTKMPFCLTGQEFWPEYNVGIFIAELADRIFSGPRKKWKIISKEKKIRLNFV